MKDPSLVVMLFVLLLTSCAEPPRPPPPSRVSSAPRTREGAVNPGDGIDREEAHLLASREFVRRYPWLDCGGAIYSGETERYWLFDFVVGYGGVRDEKVCISKETGRVSFVPKR